MALIKRYVSMLFWIAYGPASKPEQAQDTLEATSYKEAYSRFSALFEGEWYLHWYDRSGCHRSKRVRFKTTLANLPATFDKGPARSLEIPGLVSLALGLREIRVIRNALVERKAKLAKALRLAQNEQWAEGLGAWEDALKMLERLIDKIAHEEDILEMKAKP